MLDRELTGHDCRLCAMAIFKEFEETAAVVIRQRS
jgi:hypothetical protein